MYRRSATPSLLFLLTSLLAGCGSSSSSGPTTTPATTPAAAADVVITIRGISGGMSYSPAAATMKAGQTVSWQNADSTTHTSTADGGAFNTGNVSGGGTTSPIRISTAGTFPYHCGIHPSMVGTLTVTP